jgi:hypothetical protein
MRSKIIELIKSKGYKEFKSGLYADRLCFQRRVESEVVCECNDRLHINIFCHPKDNILHLVPNANDSYEMQIVAENKSVWYDLKAYGLSEDDISENIETLENNLIKMFNSLEFPLFIPTEAKISKS